MQRWWGITAPLHLKDNPLSYFENLPTKAPLLQCMQKPGQIVFIPSGMFHTVLNIEHSVALTENIGTLEAIEEIMEELARRPKDVPGVSRSAPSECLSALKAHFLDDMKQDDSGAIPYHRRYEERLIVNGYRSIVFLFDTCREQDRQAFSTAFTALKKEEATIVKVDCSSQDEKDLRASFEVDSSVPSLRVAKLSAGIFRFKYEGSLQDGDKV